MPRKFALEVVQWATLEEVAAARFLFFKDKHVAAIGFTAILETVLPGLDVQNVQELGTHDARVLGSDNLVPVDVEAVETHLIVARATVPLVARPDRAVAISTVKNRGDEKQGNCPPRTVEHRSCLCITLERLD